MTNVQGNNGPRVGSGTGRNRQTVVNQAGKKKGVGMPSNGYVPPVSPDSAIGFGSQTAQARYELLAQLASLRAQRGEVVGGFQAERGALREQRLTDVSAAANAAQSRGLLGSSIDMTGRAQAHTDFAEGIAAARSAKAQALLGLQQERMGAQSSYYMSLADIAAQRSTEQAMAAIAGFQDNAYGTQGGYNQLFRELLQRFQAQKSGRAPRKRRGLGPVSGGAIDTRIHDNGQRAANGHKLY